jgi:long-chain acyl-CoA synthetase
MNVSEYLLQESATSDAPALITLSGEHTHRQVCDAVDRVAAFLLRAGARKGDRVMVMARNSMFWVAAYLGAMRAGCTCVPLDIGIEKTELDYILQTTSPVFAFVDHGRPVHLLQGLRPQIAMVLDSPDPCANTGTFSFSDLLNGSDDRAACHTEINERTDIAALMFTSGSTGRPRGVMVSHRNIIANTASIIAYLGLSGADRVMAVLPFHYCFGTSLLHTHLRAGASLVVDNRFMYPDTILERMQSTNCTGFAGVPAHYLILLRSSRLKQIRLPRLRWLQQAGGKLPAHSLSELRRLLPGVRVFVMYGQTEATARLSYLPPELLDSKTGSIGQGIPGVRLQVLNGNDTPIAPGQTGEIVAEGENIALGYWGDEAETSATFRDGKLRTGDIATIDQDGFIYIVDRAKEFLKCGGTRVSCSGIEEKLLEFPELVEAAVVGMPDPILGEAVMAFVVPRNGAADLTEQLRRFCTERLPPPLVPKEFVVVDALPKNTAGKILKSRLKANSGAANLAAYSAESS